MAAVDLDRDNDGHRNDSTYADRGSDDFAVRRTDAAAGVGSVTPRGRRGSGAKHCG